MRVSQLVMYSYGVVAANKPLSTNDIEVTPMEAVTMTNGELTDNLNSSNLKGQDADGAAFETTVNSAVSITARWLPFGSNRKTSPNVRRGEKVCIWKFADADKYYWSELEYDPKLRKLETVIYTFSNTQDENAEATADTTYFLEVSTHNKIIHLHTSQSDGEAYGYDFIINAKENNFQFRDTAENAIFLDSAENRIALSNAAGSSFDLFGPDLFINIPGNMVTRVGGDMTTTVTGKYALNAEGGYSTTTPKADFVTPILETSAKFISGDDAQVGGALMLAKGMTTGVGGGGGSGSIQLNGSIQATGGAVFSGTVSAPNID